MECFISVLGIFIFVVICWACSQDRRHVNWRLVFMGITVQLVSALLVLRTHAGRMFFSAMNEIFMGVYAMTQTGARFLVGAMVDTFLFGALSPVIVYSALTALLYHFGIMQRLVYWTAPLMRKTLSTSGSESMCTAANIFIDQTEAPLVIKPYVRNTTESELLALMSVGMATVAGSVMAAYIGMLAPHFPDIAGHLMAASTHQVLRYASGWKVFH